MSDMPYCQQEHEKRSALQQKAPPSYQLESRPTLHLHPAMLYPQRLPRPPVPCVAPLVSLRPWCPCYYLLALSVAFVVQGPWCHPQNYCQRCTLGQPEAPPLERCPLCLVREGTASAVVVFLCDSHSSPAPPSSSRCCRTMSCTELVSLLLCRLSDL